MSKKKQSDETIYCQPPDWPTNRMGTLLTGLKAPEMLRRSVSMGLPPCGASVATPGLPCMACAPASLPSFNQFTTNQLFGLI